MRYVWSGNLGALLFAGLLALAACGPAGKPADESMFTADLTGLEVRANELPVIVYVRPDASSSGDFTFADFNSFIVDPVQVNYTDPGIRELSPEDIGRLQASFHDKMVDELTRAGYEVGTRAEAGTLRISFVIANLRAASSVPNVTSAVAPYAISVREVTIEAIFRDALTNRIDAVALHRMKASEDLNATPWSTFADVERSFDIWTKGIREAIDSAHGS